MRLYLHTASRRENGPAFLHADCGEDKPSKVLADNYFHDPDGQARAGDWAFVTCHGGEVNLVVVLTSVKPIRCRLVADSRQGLVPGRRRT